MSVKRGFLVALLAMLCLAAVGQKSTEIVLLKFSDRPEEPVTRAFVSDVVFNQYADWLLAESRGVSWVEPGQVWGWWTLPHPASHYCSISPGGVVLNCNGLYIMDDARPLMLPHFDPASKGLVVLLINAYPGGAGGRNIVWAGKTIDLRMMAHEGGHAEKNWLMHSGSWLCPAGDVPQDLTNVYTNPECTWNQYGDTFDIMGSPAPCCPFESLHFNTNHRDMLEWQQPSNISVVTSSVTTTLTRADIPTPSVQEIRIPVFQEAPFRESDGQYYYSIEYRAGIGVLVRLRAPYAYALAGSHTLLLNGDYSWDPDPHWSLFPAVTASNPFSDPYRGISVQLVSSNPTSATVAIVTPGIGDVTAPRRVSNIRRGA